MRELVRIQLNGEKNSMELELRLGDGSKPFKFGQGQKGSSEGLGRGKAGDNEENDEDQSCEDGSVQLSLQLPHPWSSDNGSSESAARGRNVNKLPATAVVEDVSSVNSVGSPLQQVVYRNAGVNERVSDDEESGLNITRKKLRLSKEQSAFLEQSFKQHSTLNPKQKLALSKQLNLRPRQVEVWFQNRRARTKLKQTEVDCEHLKRCCETLTEENRRLHKELQDLRALKSTNPTYTPTTLTMCPSCERVAAAAPPPPPNNPAAAAVSPRFYPFLAQPLHHRQPAASSNSNSQSEV